MKRHISALMLATALTVPALAQQHDYAMGHDPEIQYIRDALRYKLYDYTAPLDSADVIILGDVHDVDSASAEALNYFARRNTRILTEGRTLNNILDIRAQSLEKRQELTRTYRSQGTPYYRLTEEGKGTIIGIEDEALLDNTLHALVAQVSTQAALFATQRGDSLHPFVTWYLTEHLKFPFFSHNRKERIELLTILEESAYAEKQHNERLRHERMVQNSIRLLQQTDGAQDIIFMGNSHVDESGYQMLLLEEMQKAGITFVAFLDDEQPATQKKTRDTAYVVELFKLFASDTNPPYRGSYDGLEEWLHHELIGE